MPWKRGEKIPTNLIIGFLGSGKTTTISKLLASRPSGEHWSILINEFGTVSVDQALLDSSSNEIAIEELGGGCVCCTMSFAFRPLMAQFIRRSKPDRLILEPSGLSHPAKVVDMLRSDDFSGAIELKNIICLVDPKEVENPRWKESEVFQDQIQLADIVVLNWTDCRERAQINRCREWIETFDPPKELILESSYGEFSPDLLDLDINKLRYPLFKDAHPVKALEPDLAPDLVVLNPIDKVTPSTRTSERNENANAHPMPGSPLRFENQNANFTACGWVFHLDDIFDRNSLLDFLGSLKNIVRLKGIFRCQKEWWAINRVKNTTDWSPSAYRRDSRLEIILEKTPADWRKIERRLLDCLADK